MFETKGFLMYCHKGRYSHPKIKSTYQEHITFELEGKMSLRYWECTTFWITTGVGH